MLRGWPTPRIIREFTRNSSGNIAVLFGICLVPLAAAVGAAFDYSRVSAVRSKLDNAADVAALASVSKNANPFLNTPTEAGVQQWFNAAVGTIPGVTITGFQATITPSVTNMVVTVNYTASVQTTIPPPTWRAATRWATSSVPRVSRRSSFAPRS